MFLSVMEVARERLASVRRKLDCQQLLKLPRAFTNCCFSCLTTIPAAHRNSCPVAPTVLYSPFPVAHLRSHWCTALISGLLQLFATQLLLLQLFFTQLVLLPLFACELLLLQLFALKLIKLQLFATQLLLLIISES